VCSEKLQEKAKLGWDSFHVRRRKLGLRESLFETVFSELLETMNGVANDWKCEGLGSVKQDKNTAWFAVVTVGRKSLLFVFV
jgi:hypothetical protein